MRGGWRQARGPWSSEMRTPGKPRGRSALTYWTEAPTCPLLYPPTRRFRACWVTHWPVGLTMMELTEPGFTAHDDGVANTDRPGVESKSGIEPKRVPLSTGSVVRGDQHARVCGDAVDQPQRCLCAARK